MAEHKIELYIIEEERVTPEYGEQTITTIFTDPKKAHKEFIANSFIALDKYGEEYDNEDVDESQDVSDNLDDLPKEVAYMNADNFESLDDSFGGNGESRTDFSLYKTQVDISEENIIRLIERTSADLSDDTRKKLIRILSE